MPRYYKDKIYTNPHQKALVIEQARAYSEDNPKPICYVEHENLLRKLQRKMQPK